MMESLDIAQGLKWLETAGVHPHQKPTIKPA
jgi:hypothetical protein